jgi:hypothetical protein
LEKQQMGKLVEPAASKWCLSMAFEADRLIRACRAHVHRGPAHQQRHNEVGYMDAVALSLNVPAFLLHVFGGWQKAQKAHFSDGGIFDQIYTPGK